MANPCYARNVSGAQRSTLPLRIRSWTEVPPDQQRWLPFHTKVKVDCWSSLCQLLTHPTRINRSDCLSMWKWNFTVDPLCVDCQSALPLGSIEAIAFPCKSESWLLILSVLIIDHSPLPQDQQRQLPFHVKVKGNCWSSLCQLLIPPRINNRGDCLKHRRLP